MEKRLVHPSRWPVAAVALIVAGMLAGCGSSDGSMSSHAKPSADKSATTSAPSASTTIVRDAVGSASAPEIARVEGAGEPGKDSHIIGGSEVGISELPWMVALVQPGSSDNFCTGALIAPTIVLTAGHCVVDHPPKGAGGDPKAYYLFGTADAVLGRTALSDSGGERIAAREVWVDAKYDPKTLNNDHALVFLSKASGQTPILLPARAATNLWAEGGPIYVAGWGCTRDIDAKKECEKKSDASGGDPLRVAEETVLPSSRCTTVMGDASSGGFDPVSHFCTIASSSPDLAGASCFGDSGGPFMTHTTDGRWYAVGVVSYASPAPSGTCPVDLPEAPSLLQPILADEGGDLVGDWKTCDTGSACRLPAATGG